MEIAEGVFAFLEFTAPIIGMFCISAGCVASRFLHRDILRKKDESDKFFANEVKRCLEHSYEVPKTGWFPGINLLTRGWTVIEKDGRKTLIRQAKVCGPSLCRFSER